MLLSPIGRRCTILLKSSTGFKTEPHDMSHQKFDQDRVKGAAAKEILRSLLESSGYDVYPFGYESTLSVLKGRFGDKRQDNRVAQRIRSMPDFLVVDPEDTDLPQLVEIKFRKAHDRPSRIVLNNRDLERYRKYWPESVLVLLSPYREHFFAQYVEKLVPDGNYFEQTWFEFTAFSSIQNFFSRTAGRLEPLLVGIDKLAGLWVEEEREVP